MPNERQRLAEVDRALPVNDPRSLADQVASPFDTFITGRLAGRLVSVFGALARVDPMVAMRSE